MADGASYEIGINAKSTGLDSASSQLTSLADALEIGQAKYNQLEMASTKANQALEKASMAAASVEKLAAAFENASAKATAQASAVEAAKSNLAALAAAGDTSAAALATAGAAVDAAAAKYADLTTNAGIAERALAKATKSGAQVGELQAAADAAASAVAGEAAALDKLKAAAKGAATQEKELADAAKQATDASKANTEGFLKGAKAVVGGPIFEKIDLLKGAFEGSGKGAAIAGIAIGAVVTGIGLAVKAAKMLAQAFIAVGVAAVTGVIAMATYAIKTSEAAMKSLGATTKKAKSDFAKLFAGVGAEKFSDAVGGVAAMLDESTSSGKALKELVQTILVPLFNQAPAAGAVIQQLFKQAIILALQAETAIYLVKNALEGGKPLDPQLEMSLRVLAASAMACAVAMGLLALAVLVIVASVLIIPAIIFAAMAALYMLTEVLLNLGGSSSTAGKMIIDGLVNGITSGSGKVVDAIKNMASSASNALVNAFKIGSPSKLFFEYGGYTAEGLENGITAGTSGVTSAMETMATPPDALENGEMAGKKTGGGSSGKGANISGNTFVFNGVKDAADAESKFGSMLTRLLEGDVLSLGGEVPA